MANPLVTVCIITFNHEQFIQKCIDSVLMQATNFDWKILIADDCSTDNTRPILSEYKKKHPEHFDFIFQKKNVGPAQNFIDLVSTPSTKYIAYLDGDDFWTDSLKLRRQIEFLEKNEEYSICSHNTDVLHENTDETKKFEAIDQTFELKDFVLGTLIGRSTCSIVFRNSPSLKEKIKSAEYYSCPGGDWALCIYLLQEGKMKYFGKSMATYRIHDKGSFSAKSDIEKTKKNIQSAWCINTILENKYWPSIRNKNVRYVISKIRRTTEEPSVYSEYWSIYESIQMNFLQKGIGKWKKMKWFWKSPISKLAYLAFPVRKPQ